MLIIPQGKPNSGYFLMAIPPDQQQLVNQMVKCVHPVSKKETTGRVVDTITELWANLPDSYCLLAYGRKTHELKAALEKAFPEFRNHEKIRFLLIKEL